MTCLDNICAVKLSVHNHDARCYRHASIHVELQKYVEDREVALVGLERWSAGRTSKHHIRDCYVRKFINQGVIPWEATLEEVEVCDCERLTEIREALVEPHPFFLYRSGKSLDTEVGAFTYDEAVLVNDLVPETNFLTRWYETTTQGFYQRFRSPLDEVMMYV